MTDKSIEILAMLRHYLKFNFYASEAAVEVKVTKTIHDCISQNWLKYCKSGD